MGQGIFYCGRCQRQLRSSDLDKGSAVRVGGQVLCRTCAPADLPSPSPPPSPTRRARVSSGHIPRISDTPRSMRAAAAKPSTSWIPFAVAGGVALVVLVVAVAASTGNRPVPRDASTAPPGVVAPPSEPPPSPPRPEPPARPPVERPQPAPAAPDYTRELAELDGQVRPYADKGQFANALLLLEAARGRHPGDVWTSAIDRRLAEVAKARDKAAPAPPRPAPPPASAPREPVAHWRLDERTGTRAADAAGAFPGVLKGGASWNADPPALKLDGKSGCVAVGNPDLLRRVRAATFAAWLLPQGNGVKSCRILTIDRGGSQGLRPRFGIEIDADAHLRFFGRAGDAEPDTKITGTSARLATDRWQHAAVAVDYAGRTVRIYLDGQELVTSGRTSFEATETSDTAASKAALGAWGTLEGAFYRGLMADARLYARALEPAEIKALAAARPRAPASDEPAAEPPRAPGSAAPPAVAPAATGPTAWWRLLEGSGKKAADTAGTFPGMLEGQAAWNDWPSALRLDGQKGAVLLGENVDLLRKIPAATLSAWIRPEAPSALLAPGRIATFTTPVEEGRRPASRLSFEIADGNHLRFVGRAADDEEETRITASAVRVVRDRWQHAAVVVDYAGRSVRIYLDGREQTVTGTAGFSSAHTSDTPVGRALLGASETETRVYRGLLSDVRLYDRALGAPEVAALAATPPPDPDGPRPERVKDGLVALYTFEEGSGDRIRDVSGVGDPLDLTLGEPAAIRWLRGGGLEIVRPTQIASAGPAAKIARACKQSNEVSLEAWVRPARTEVKGPARIVTISANTSNRNCVLGQGRNANDPEAAVWSVRCRSTKTDANGMPGMSSPDGSVTGRLAHLTYTRSAAGKEQLYLDGSPLVAGPHEGDFRSWDESYRLLLGNELSKDRAWLGELRLVAVYARALTPAEVQRNFLARTD